MLCTNCNSQIDDNATQCPFCGTPTTMNVDPGMQQGYNQQASYTDPAVYGAAAGMGGAAMNGGKDLEKEASTIQTLGIVGLILSFCCCVGPILGIIGLVKVNGLKQSMYMLSEHAQKQVNTGKILCIIAVALYAVSLVISFATGVFKGIADAAAN